MPLVRGRIANRQAVVSVGLQPTLPIVSEVVGQSAANSIPIHEFRRLIDTGAQVTLVTRAAIQRLGLRPRGKRPLGNVNDISIHRTFGFIVGVWYARDEGQSMNETRGYFAFDPILGCEFPDRPDFDILIGMDLIGQGDLLIRRNGEFEWVLGSNL